jgi:glycosyltransferase involved in cell wall biosynthesis
MPEKTSLALIVPCYNEAESIPYFETELLRFQAAFTTEFPGAPFSVTVVENNSSDASPELLVGLKARLPFVKVENCKVQGYGAALKHGFERAESQYIGFLDLDNTYPLLHLIDLLKLLQSQSLDIVYGARLHAGSEIGIVRKAGNLLYVWLLKAFFNSTLSDVCSGMRIFKSARKSEVVALLKNDLSFSIEFTAHALSSNWKVAELPIPYRDRVGDSKLSIVKDGFAFLFVIVRKFFRNS